MATALELGLRKGDIVTTVAAHIEGGAVGVPLTHPGATIDAIIVEIIKPSEGGAHVKALASTDLYNPAGKEWYIWDGFNNYVGEGMERTHRELVQAGAVIQPIRDEERNIIDVEVHNVNETPTPQE